MAGRNESSHPVTLVLQRRWGRQQRWRYADWQLVGVLPGDHEQGEPGCRVLQTGQGDEHFIWSGCALRLYRDALPAYYENLVGRRPTLYVLCHEDPRYGLVPIALTADHSEAEAHMETGETVLSTALQPPLSRYVAEYILAHRDYLSEKARASQSRRHKRRRKPDDKTSRSSLG